MHGAQRLVSGKDHDVVMTSQVAVQISCEIYQHSLED